MPTHAQNASLRRRGDAYRRRVNGVICDWPGWGTHAQRRPMGAEPGDKTQVPQQYGWQYKFDACNMSFSQRNLASVSTVSRYARRDVTFACAARRETAMQVG